MNPLKNRNQFAELLNQKGLYDGAAFIGVAEGYFEFAFLDKWPGKAYLIDAWRLLDAPGFSGHGEDTQIGQDARYERIEATARRYFDRADVIRETSEEAAKLIQDRSLDFVYIDADHSTAGITNDLKLWEPKVRPGGILAGHDYLAGFYNGQEYGVKTVVDAFATSRGLTVNVVPEEWPSFYLVL